MNKKLLLSGAALLAASTAMAEISEVTQLVTNFDILPPEVCVGNSPQFLTFDYEGNYYVLDEDFVETKRFSIPNQRSKTVETEYIAVPLYNPRSTDTHIIADGTKFTLSTAITYLEETTGNSSFKIIENDNETWFVDYFYNNWECGDVYPQHYYMLTSDGTLYEALTEYDDTVAGYTDTWREYYEPRENEHDYSHIDIDISIDGIEVDDYRIPAVQAFFNEDEAYEFLMPILKSDTKESYYGNCINGKYEYKRVVTGDFISGVKLMNDKGETLHTFDCGDSNIYAAHLYIVGKNRYLELGDILYRVNAGGSTKLAEVSMPMGLKISPRVAQRSMPIDVTVGDSKSERTIKVVSTSGMVMTTTSIAAGSTSTSIDTSRLPAGMYVVVVNDGEKNVENCKIVIR